MTLLDIVQQLWSCGFKCEAGPLDKNLAFQKLKEMATSGEPKYTTEDLKNCFEQSRLTHPMVGFKHDTFEDLIESIKA